MTNSERCKRRMSDNSSCAICGHNMETTAHSLRDCPSIRVIWQSVVLVCLEDVFYLVPIDSWLVGNLWNVKDVMFRGVCWEIMFIVLVWKIWTSRNQFIFCNASHSVADIVSSSLAWAKIISKISIVNQTTVHVRWCWPLDGWYKLNTDGGVNQMAGAAVGGRWIRDSMGRWVTGFSRNIGCCLVLMVELWAVYDGLGVSWEADIRRLVVESNSQAVVDLLKSATRRDSITLVDDSKPAISTMAGGRAVCGARCQFCGCCHGQIRQGSTSGHSFISTTSCFG
ncbi:hypothetical protein V6Z11_A06G046400 [Gossypium hirsutum]